MASIVSAGTTSATALNMSADTTGVLQLASNNGTVALTVDTSQNIQIGTTTVAAPLTDVLTVGKNSTSYDASIVIRQFGNGTAAQLQLIAANDTGATYNSISSTTSGGTQHWKLGGTGGAAGALPIFTSGTERVRITAAGLFQFNNGFGSVATAYGVRAWVNFNGDATVTIRASGNVSSITDGGVGIYTINLTTALTDTNYATTTGVWDDGVSAIGGTVIRTIPSSSSAITIRTQNPDGTARDNTHVQLAILR